MATNLKLIPRAERLLEGKITADMTDSQTTVTVDNPPLITALPSYLEIDPDSSTYRELCRVIAVSSSTITLERGLNNGGTGFPHSNNTAYKFKFTSRHWEAVATALESGYLTEDSSYVFTQVSTSSFKITASSVDRTDKYTQGRRVRLNGSVVTRIVSSSYSNPDTTVVVEGTSVPAVITTVEIELTTEGNTNVFIPYDYIDTDDTLTANSDTKLPSQKAVKTYVDTNITVTADSTTTFTNKDLTSETNILPSTGWNPARETWTRESDNSFSEPIDATLKYQKGDKIRYKQGGAYKYQYVISIGAYSGGKTIITTTGGADYVFTNGTAITDNYYSHQENPIGFPDWFAWTPTYTGFSSNPTHACFFNLKGRTCSIKGYPTGAGTSNAASFRISLPIAPSTTGIKRSYSYGWGVDNGSPVETIFKVSGNDDAANLILSKGLSESDNWTTSGDKYVYIPPMFYEIA